MALAERQLYDLALLPFSKAARLDPENFEPHYNLGLTYFKMRNYAAGRPTLEAAVRLRPEFFDAVAVLGTTLFALGDDYGAATYLRHAHELKPDNEKIKTLLFEQLKVIAQHLASSRDYAQARPFLEEALRLKPDAADLHFTFAQVAAALGDGAKAELVGAGAPVCAKDRHRCRPAAVRPEEEMIGTAHAVSILVQNLNSVLPILLASSAQFSVSS